MSLFQSAYPLIARMPLESLLQVGGIMATIVILWSYNYWRAAVKMAFILVLVEGAIRKWLVPQGQELVYFGKDLLLFGAYIRFYLSPDPELRAWRLNVPTTLVILLCLGAGVSALNPNIGAPVLALIGLKSYFMYIPMAFMMPYLFRNRDELLRQATYFALMATPICLLGFLQWRSDRFSVINTFASGMIEGGATGFGFGEKARITGTFSYITGHSTFVLFFLSLHVALLLTKLPKVTRAWLLFNLPLLVANGLMGGSRSSIYGVAMVIGGLLLFSTTHRLGSNAKALANLGLAGIIVAIGSMYFFYDAVVMWSTRKDVSGDTVQSRVIDQAKVASQMAFETVGVAGFGMGTSMPVTQQLRNALGIPKPKEPPPPMDHELTQVVVEMGLVCAALWYVLRFLFLGLSYGAFKECRDDELRPLILVCFLLQLPFLYLSVVLNHTANFMLWGFIGISMIPKLGPTVLRRFEPAMRRVARQAMSLKGPAKS